MSKLAGRVAKVIDPMELVINLGTASGVQKGAQFLVYALGDEVVDPETRESLGLLEIVRGVGEVTNVQEKMATLRSTGKKSVRMKRVVPTIDAFRMAWNTAAAPRFETEFYDQDEEVPFVNVQVGDLVRAL